MIYSICDDEAEGAQAEWAREVENTRREGARERTAQRAEDHAAMLGEFDASVKEAMERRRINDPWA